MDNIKDDAHYVRKSLEELTLLVKYGASIKTPDDLTASGSLTDSIMFRLIQLAEHIKGLSADFKEKYPMIPWGDIIGFRNGLVHEYGKTDYTVVFEILRDDIPELKELFEKALLS